jgi:hypothetical protein
MDSKHTTHASRGGKEHYKHGNRVQKKTKYLHKKYYRRQRRRGFPNYGNDSSSQYEELIKPGVDVDMTDSKGKGKIEQAPPLLQPGTVTGTNAKFSGPRTLAELRKRHDELEEYIKNMKKSIASHKEAVAKEAARKAVQQAKLARGKQEGQVKQEQGEQVKQEQEAIVVKAVEMKLEEMDIDLDADGDE